jgi:4a-hydroxytetrahydrobiopterin dehydratase
MRLPRHGNRDDAIGGGAGTMKDMRTPLLTPDELDQRLVLIPAWSRVDDRTISRTFTFDSFLDAIHFVTRIADAAEGFDHHPDIDIRYRKVTLSLSTHDSGGLTHLDTDLAARCDELAQTVR